jgi:hypothetical protein
MEGATKAALRCRFSRSVNMMARSNPVNAPRHASVIERLLKVRSPWPVNRNPVYAMVEGHRITRSKDIRQLVLPDLERKANPNAPRLPL